MPKPSRKVPPGLEINVDLDEYVLIRWNGSGEAIVVAVETPGTEENPKQLVSINIDTSELNPGTLNQYGQFLEELLDIASEKIEEPEGEPSP